MWNNGWDVGKLMDGMMGGEWHEGMLLGPTLAYL